MDKDKSEVNEYQFDSRILEIAKELSGIQKISLEAALLAMVINELGKFHGNVHFHLDNIDKDAPKIGTG